MEGAFIGSIVFEFIGVFFRWLFMFLLKKCKGEKTIGFSKAWKGRDTNDFASSMGYGISNILLGMIMMIFVILILKIIMS